MMKHNKTNKDNIDLVKMLDALPIHVQIGGRRFSVAEFVDLDEKDDNQEEEPPKLPVRWGVGRFRCGWSSVPRSRPKFKPQRSSQLSYRAQVTVKVPSWVPAKVFRSGASVVARLVVANTPVDCFFLMKI